MTVCLLCIYFLQIEIFPPGGRKEVLRLRKVHEAAFKKYESYKIHKDPPKFILSHN